MSAPRSTPTELRKTRALLASLLLFAACTRDPAQPVGEAAKPPADAVAVAGEVWVTVEELNHRLKGQQLDGATEQQIRDAAKDLLDEKLLAFEAERRGLANEPEIRLQIDELRRRVLTDALLKREVTEPSPEELKRWYDEHPTAFQKPARARVARIVLPPDQKALAQKLLAEAKKGTPLSTVAQKNSTSALPLREEVLVVTEKAHGGMGEAPMKSPEGQLGFAETDQYLFVFKVLEKLPAERPAFEESHVRSRIRVQLKAERRHQARQALAKLAAGPGGTKLDEAQIRRVAASLPARAAPPAEPQEEAAPAPDGSTP